MKIMEKIKDAPKGTPEPWPEKLPHPYQEGRVTPLKDFLHGRELIDRQEASRRARKKWAEDYLGVGKDDE